MRRAALVAVAVPAPQQPAPSPATSPAAAPAPGDAGPFLTERLRALDAKLEETARRVMQEGDREALHDLRVAMRRARTLLEVGRPIFGRFYADEVRDAFVGLQRATSALRDEEVLLDILESLSAKDDEVAAWITSRRRRERRLRSAVRGVVRRGDLAHVRALLGALLIFRIKPSRERRLAKFARRAVGRAARDLERHRASSDTTEGLHRLRIAYKRLRYTAEAFTEVLPRELGTGLARTASVFQSRLGLVRDLDVAVASVERARGLSATGRQALLTALRHQRTERLGSARTLLDGAAARQPLSAYSGTDSLRKTSIR